MTTLFISDLHLSHERPQIVEIFFKFLQQHATQAEAVYILGDFFDYWIGDDAGMGEQYKPVNEALRQFTQTGIPTYFMRGNRDFLVGEKFAEYTGVQLLEDEAVIDLYGEKVLIMHGDSLTTDDAKQQEFRHMVLNSDWQRAFLSKTIEERLEMAKQARIESAAYQAGMQYEDIMDVNKDTVDEAMRRHGVTQMIHGHTHRPQIHDFVLDDQPAKRCVLDAWYSQGNVLICTPEERLLDYIV